MARLITKFKYLKPEDRKNIGGYAEYIATREGVEKIDESKRNAPATNKQKQLIKKILSDFPDSRSSLEYEDYLKEKTVRHWSMRTISRIKRLEQIRNSLPVRLRKTPMR